MNGSSTIARMNALNGMCSFSSSASHRPERELDHAGDERVEERVPHRQPEHAVGHQELVVLDADPLARPADLGIGEAEKHAETERIGQEHQQQRAAGSMNSRPRKLRLSNSARRETTAQPSCPRDGSGTNCGLRRDSWQSRRHASRSTAWRAARPFRIASGHRDRLPVAASAIMLTTMKSAMQPADAVPSLPA